MQLQKQLDSTVYLFFYSDSGDGALGLGLGERLRPCPKNLRLLNLYASPQNKPLLSEIWEEVITIVAEKEGEHCSVPLILMAIIVQKNKHNNDGNRGIIDIILLSRNSFFIFINVHICEYVAPPCVEKLIEMYWIFAVFSSRCLFL